jgi:pimeloyl-ACP methyl ester carboxylesterase
MASSSNRPLTRKTKYDVGLWPTIRAHPYSSVGATAAVALLGASATVNVLLAKQAETKNPPLGRFVSVDGVRLHYIERDLTRGQSETIVLLHGNGSMAQDFACSGLIDRAARTFRVLAFDRPGFGYSERPRSKIWTAAAQAGLLYDALQKLCVKHAIVFGHSWGAAPALELALLHPEFVSRLVLASGYYYPTARTDVLVGGQPAIPLIGDLMRFTISPLLTRALWPRMVRRLFWPNPIPPAFAEFPKELVFRPSQIRASAEDAALQIPAAALLRQRYHKISTPTVIVAGDQDHFARHSARLRQDIPDSVLIRVPGNGHMVHYTAIQSILAAIDQVGAEPTKNART